MDFTGASGANFRIFAVPIKGKSYLSPQPPYRDPCSLSSSSDTVTLTEAQYRGFLTAIIVEGTVLVCSLLYYLYHKRKTSLLNSQIISDGSYVYLQ